ncbi:hypothetical protein JTE90_019602 [Oedothorax gibbosus]|uniref:sn-1-specific diacylglycerol lipase ABHD11 n=1 Tax=Oedothorax gibbosus TaxID=931172 RepID=A0AAV6V729_9ARAC|nr:hypothetical protein JTE90_019602 [Oedothorax gibbosus]
MVATRTCDIYISQNSSYNKMENAVKLSYDAIESNGTRPDLCPVIMMHGLFWNKFMLKDLAIKLNQMTQRKVFTLDLRNHGESPCPKDCGAVLMAEDVKLFIDDMNLKRVSFVCHSFSSTIAYLVGLDRVRLLLSFTTFNQKAEEKEH